MSNWPASINNTNETSKTEEVDAGTWKDAVQPLPILNPERKPTLESRLYVMVPQESVPYKFFGEFSFDKDAEDCMGTGTLRMPYDPVLWSFWEPGFQELEIHGGTYDFTKLFKGRTRGIKLDGEEIEIKLQDCGWRLKQQYEGDEPKGSVATAFNAIVKKAGMIPVISGLQKDYQIGGDDGEGTISGSATGGIVGSYGLDSSGSSSEDKTTYSGSNITQYSPAKTDTSNCICVDMPKTGAASVIEENRTHCWDKCCPRCIQKYGTCQELQPSVPGSGGYSTITWSNNGATQLTCKNCHNSFDGNTGFVKSNSITNKMEECTGGSYVSTGMSNTTPSNTSTSSNSGQESSSEKSTYEELIQNMCEGNDLLFYTDFNNQCILYDYPSLMAEIEDKAFETETWMIQYPSFVLDVNQFGYYNTVEVTYSGGKIKESYEDLVSVFGEIVKKYDAPDLNRDGAIEMAKATLATLLRDFAMEVKTEILHSGALLPGTFIKTENPVTAIKETYYISGISVSHDPGSKMMCSLTLLYAPKNPEVTTIPEIAGTSGTTDGQLPSNATLDEIGKLEAKYTDCQNQPRSSDWRNMEADGCGDCWADAQWLYNRLNAAGIPCRVMAYPGGGPAGSWYRHTWVEIDLGKGFVQFPYRQWGGYHLGNDPGYTSYVLVAPSNNQIDVNTFLGLGY